MKTLRIITFFLIAANCFTPGNAGNWHNHRNTQWGTGYNQQGLFVINTAEDMAQLAWMVSMEGKSFQGKTVQLQPADGKPLDLSLYWWTPAGTNDNRFSGTFDGGGNTVCGVKIDMPGTDYIGLFGVLGAEGVIRNLNVVIGKEGISGGNRAAGLAASCHGKIRNCTVTGGIITAKGYSIGGLAGSAYPGSDIRDCSVSVQIEASGVYKFHAGGLVGYQDDCHIFNCKASGTITLQNAGTSDAGGLIGYQKSGSAENCHAEAAITIKSSESMSTGKLIGRKDE